MYGSMFCVNRCRMDQRRGSAFQTGFAAAFNRLLYSGTHSRSLSEQIMVDLQQRQCTV